MAHIITVTGPSGAGKSTTLRMLEEAAHDGFRPTIVPKYTTRPAHADDCGEVLCVGEEEFPKTCNLVYEQYGYRYGLILEDLCAHIVEGKSPVVILNDVRTVEDVRNHWKGLVRSLFIFRKSPTLEGYEKLAEKREVDTGKEDPQIRYQRAQMLYRTYIENIHIFDHVIINCGTLGELRMQVNHVVKGLETYLNWPLHNGRKMP